MMIYVKEYKEVLNYSLVLVLLIGVVFGWIGAIYG